MRVTAIVFGFVLILGHFDGYASHLIGGEISVKRVQNTALTFEITVVGFSERSSPVEFGYGTLDFGDGIELSETFEKVKEIVSNDMLKTSFTVIHTFISPSAAGYLIHYSEDPGRTAAINVADNLDGLNFYVETLLVIDPFIGPNSTPVFSMPPNVKAQVGEIYRHNPGAYDPDGDKLTYRLVNIKNDVDQTIKGFQNPDHPDFYSNYESGNETGFGLPDFSIDRFTGEIIWDAPGDKTNRNGSDCGDYAVYNIAIAVDEWRYKGGAWKKLGFVVRDYVVNVCEAGDQAQMLDLLKDTCIVAGSTLEKRILIDEEQSVYINAFGVPFNKGASKKSGIDTLDISWKTLCAQASKVPYLLNVILSDRNSSPPSFTANYTWNVTVIAPPVTGITKTDQIDGSIKVSWDAYTCDEPDSLQIWRVEGLADHTLCELQDPESLGFTLTGQVETDQIVFVDQHIPEDKSANDFNYHIQPIFSDRQSESLREVLTSVKKRTRSKINFYPNPTRGNLVVDTKDQITQYRLLDLSGKTLIYNQLDRSGEIKDLSTFLKPGIYIIQFQDKYENILDTGRLILASQ